MRIVGILLVSALMTIPVACAMKLANSFKQMFVYAVIIGELSVVLGLVTAFYLDLAPGGTIVMNAVIFLVATLCWERLRYRGRKR